MSQARGEAQVSCRRARACSMDLLGFDKRGLSAAETKAPLSPEQNLSGHIAENYFLIIFLAPEKKKKAFSLFLPVALFLCVLFLKCRAHLGGGGLCPCPPHPTRPPLPGQAQICPGRGLWGGGALNTPHPTPLRAPLSGRACVHPAPPSHRQEQAPWEPRAALGSGAAVPPTGPQGAQEQALPRVR